MTILQTVYDNVPVLIQNLMVTIENSRSLRRRRSGQYDAWKRYFRGAEFLPEQNLLKLQQKRLEDYLQFVISHSPWHRDRLRRVDIGAVTVDTISQLPTMSKEELRKNVTDIVTLPRHDAYVAKTGGTTGASIELFYRWDDFQERTAITDVFRERFVDIAKSRIAWFSGKSIIPNPETAKRFSRDNWIDKIRYYSTFNIHPGTVAAYMEDLQRFRPEAIVAFPSSLVELARCARLAGLAFEGDVKAVFPTSEALTPADREVLGEFFGCGVFDQYASSEGSPFITECPSGHLHCELLTGVFEVLDDAGQPAMKGDLVVTPFGTRGTPLIRYRIEDSITLSGEKCFCGRSTPVVERIDGRKTDFVFSPERGKVNLVNIANSVKGAHGIRKFQIVQSQRSGIDLLMVVDRSQYTTEDESVFVANLRDRLGLSFTISVHHVDDIPRDPSGKHRIVLNNLPDDEWM